MPIFSRSRWFCGRRCISLVAAAVLGLTACGSSAADSGAGSLPTFLKQETPGTLMELPIYVGIRQGFFKKHGINLELVPIGSGTATAAALVNGSVDAIGQAVTFAMVFNAKNPSQRWVSIAAIWQGLSYDLVGKTTVVDSCPQSQQPYPAPLTCLRGQTIGITAIGSDNYNVMVGLLSSVGISPKDANLVAVGVGAPQTAALQAGQVNYVLAVEPTRTQLVDILHIGKVLTNVRAAPSFSTWEGQGAWALPSRIAANPKPFAAYTAGLADAMTFMADPANSTQVVAAFRSHVELPNETLKAIIDAHKEAFTGISTNCRSIAGVGAWLVETKQVTTDQVPTCNDLLWSQAPRTNS